MQGILHSLNKNDNNLNCLKKKKQASIKSAHPHQIPMTFIKLFYFHSTSGNFRFSFEFLALYWLLIDWLRIEFITSLFNGISNWFDSIIRKFNGHRHTRFFSFFFWMRSDFGHEFFFLLSFDLTKSKTQFLSSQYMIFTWKIKIENKKTKKNYIHFPAGLGNDSVIL